MFIGVDLNEFRAQVVGLPALNRGVGNVPTILVESKIAHLRAHVLLCPTEAGVVAVMGPVRLRAARAGVGSREGDLPSRLQRSRVTIEERAAVHWRGSVAIHLKAFGVSSMELVRGAMRFARWWLAYGLAGHAYQHYVKEVDEVAELLRFSASLGILPPDDEQPSLEWGASHEGFGATPYEIVMSVLSQLEAELRECLNNPQLTLSLEVAKDTDSVRTLYAGSIAVWQERYGTMWGPFT